jgi:hypothetical protein
MAHGERVIMDLDELSVGLLEMQLINHANILSDSKKSFGGTGIAL